MSDLFVASDFNSGREALLAYHNRSTIFSNYNFTFNEFLNQYGSKAEIYQKTIGLNIRLNELSTTDVRKTMDGLADIGQGRVPEKTDIIKALGLTAQQIGIERSSFDFTGFVGAVTSDIVGGAQEVGNSIITSASWILKLLPFLVVGALVFIVSMRTKQIAGKK